MPAKKDPRGERRRKFKVKHPRMSDAAIEELVSASFRANSKKAKKRSASNLIPGQSAARRAGKGKAQDAAPKRRMAAKTCDIIEFSSRLGIELHPAQSVVLKATYGLPLEPDEMDLYFQLVDQSMTKQHGYGEEAVEAVLVLGARSGKSLLASILALYESIERGKHWRKFLGKHERGYTIIVATRLQQASDLIQRNAAQLLQNSEYAGWIEGEPTKTELHLKNDLCILSMPCNSTAGRGLPIFCLILDELGHWYVEGVKADVDVYNSLAPRLAQFGGAKTVLLSTPSAKQGLLWSWYKEGFEVPRRCTFQGPTTLMNPDMDAEFLERMRTRDPDTYAREFGAEFAERRAAYLDSALVESAIAFVTDQEPGNHQYILGVDQSGLSGKDRFAVAVAHREGKRIVVDVVRSWASTDSDFILGQVSELRSKYSIQYATIDRYARGWVQAEFEKVGLRVEVRPLLPQIYQNGKSLMLAGELAIPDHPELKEGLLSTMAFYGRNNSMSIEHPRTGEAGHGDLADATMSAVWRASLHIQQEARGESFSRLGVRYPGEDPPKLGGFDPTKESFADWMAGSARRRAKSVGRI